LKSSKNTSNSTRKLQKGRHEGQLSGRTGDKILPNLGQPARHSNKNGRNLQLLQQTNTRLIQKVDEAHNTRVNQKSRFALVIKNQRHDNEILDQHEGAFAIRSERIALGIIINQPNRNCNGFQQQTKNRYTFAALLFDNKQNLGDFYQQTTSKQPQTQHFANKHFDTDWVHI
jgi:hypothetical protein